MKTLSPILLAILFLFSCTADITEEIKETITESCNVPTNLTIESSFTTANDVRISWNDDASIESFTIEYGLKPLIQGNGSTKTTTNSHIEIEGLNSDSEYEYYIQSKCNANSVSNWTAKNSFTTSEEETCWDIPFLNSGAITTTSIALTWALLGEIPGNYEVEYGLKGFSKGNGTIAKSTTSKITITALEKDTKYDFYVREKCSSSNYGAWFGPKTFATKQF